jgi:hypothetical protein
MGVETPRILFAQRPSDILLSTYLDVESAFVTPEYQLMYGLAEKTWRLLYGDKGSNMSPQCVNWKGLDHKELAESFIYMVVFMKGM